MARANKIDISPRRTMMQESRGDRIFHGLMIALTITTFIVIIYPLWFVVIASISNSDLVNQGKVTIVPLDIRFYGFQQIMKDSRIWVGYRNTILYVVAGTGLNMLITMPAAYALSRKDFKARNPVMMYFVFTMYFSGGLVPTYMVVNKLGLINSPWILIIMVALNTYNLIIARTFIQNTIPNDLYESAMLDGASHFRIFWSIVLPLSKAIIAVMALYYAVGQWNSYFNAMIFLQDEKKYPLQLVLKEILIASESTTGGSGETIVEQYRLANQIKYVSVIVSSLPVMLLYPFVQKYFAQGVMIGSLKG